MEYAPVLTFIGLLIFLAHFFGALLERTKVLLLLVAFSLALSVVTAGCSTSEQLLFSEGEQQLALEKYAQACSTFTKYLDLDPRSAGGHYNRALAFSGQGKFSNALDDLDWAIRLDPIDTDARWMRFRIQSLLRDGCRSDTTVTSAARPMKQQLESILSVSMMAELDRILEINKADYWALNERGRMKQERGEYNEALTDYDAALVLCDTCTWLLYNKALTLRSVWRTRDALAVLERLVELDDRDGDAWLLLGECRFGLGMRKEACAAFYRSMRLGVAEAQERYETLCK